jgi:hypothetical protein
MIVLFGLGDGTFQPGVLHAVWDQPRWVEVGDINTDGHLDLAITNSGSDSVSTLLNTCRWARSPLTQPDRQRPSERSRAHRDASDPPAPAAGGAG